MAFPEVGVELVVKGSRTFFGTLNKAGGAVSGFGKAAAKAALAGTAAVAGFAAVVGGASIKAAIDFESAFAGVIKTTDGLVDEMGNVNEAGREMQQEFRNLAKEVPIAVEELLAIGELGGQLGIAKESLVDFAETIAAVGEATNLTTEEAATGFAQIANIMQTPQDQIENMASSVVDLGNNFATTERDILSFGQRIAGAGQIAGLTESDIFAIGAAFSSVGVQAEAGGTAVQKVLLAMNQAVVDGGEELETFANTAGMSAERFANNFEKDAAFAFQEFVSGLGIAGDDAINILSDLGLEDQRLIRSFLSLAGAGDLLGRTLQTSGEAFRDNTALTKEAEARYRTTESQFKIFKNTIKDLGITIGQALLPFVNELLEMAKPLIAELGQRLPGFLNNLLIPAIRNVAQWLGVHLPIAIQMVSDFWQTTLLPAIRQVTEWLGQNLPIAIAFVSEAWTNVLQPAIAAVGDFLVNTFIPLLGEIFDWLSINVPMAIEFLSELWIGTLLPAIEQVSDFWQDVLLPAIESAMPVFDEVVSFVTGTLGGLVSWFQSNIPLMQETVEAVLRGISNFWRSHGETVVNLVTTSWETIKALVTSAVNIVKSIIELVMNIISGNWDAAWENIKGVLDAAWQAIKAIVSAAIEVVKAVITIVLDAIVSLWTADWTDIENVLKAAWDDIKETVNNGIKAARDIIKLILDRVVAIIRRVWDEITVLFNEGIEKAKGLLSAAVGAFENAGRAIVDAIRRGISNAWDSLVGWFKGKLKDLTDMLPLFSEPRDRRSPLFGLAHAGQEIVKNLVAGMEMATAQLRQAQLGMAATVGQTGSAQVAAAAASSMTTNTVNFNTNITNGMQASQFEQRVLRIVQGELR